MVDVATDMTDPVGDTAPDLDDGGGIAELALEVEGLGPAKELEGLGGGRILFILLLTAGAARGIPAILWMIVFMEQNVLYPARERTSVGCYFDVLFICLDTQNQLIEL